MHSTTPQRSSPRRRLLPAFALLLAIGSLLAGALPAAAHGFTSVASAELSSDRDGVIHTKLQLEYDLLVVSAADAEHDDGLFRDGTPAFDSRDPKQEAAALEAHLDTVLAYVAKRFTITADGRACTPTIRDRVGMTIRQDAPYAVLRLDSRCPVQADAHVVTSTLFPDSEGYVRSTKTILTYHLDTQTGSAALDAEQPSFSTEQSFGERFWEFFRLGAEHLLTGIDHILFLLALIAG